MPHRIFSAGKLVRSLFFIAFVGGLLFCISYTFSYIANHYLYDELGLEEPVSILELAGLVAFVYVIFFGIKFGFRKSNSQYQEFQDYERPHAHDDSSDSSHHFAEDLDCDELSQKYKTSLDKLSEKEKEELKSKLANICGIDPHDTEDY